MVEEVGTREGKDAGEIKDGRGLGAGAPSNTVEASLVGGRELASALGNIERD